nr:MAG: hypothetical protein DIU56_07870 [Pseudomonadota bacterium]
MCQESRATFIRELCQRWAQEAQPRPGTITLGASERYRLYRNGIEFPELSYMELQAATLGLLQNLLLPGLNTIIDSDHRLLWSWQAEFLLSRHVEYLAAPRERELRQLLQIAVRCALADSMPPWATREQWEEMRANSQKMEFNLRELRSHFLFRLR